jgi:hypothetical protein
MLCMSTDGQCCGDGMFIPGSWILIFYPFRIPDPQQKRGMKKNVVSYLFL